MEQTCCQQQQAGGKVWDHDYDVAELVWWLSPVSGGFASQRVSMYAPGQTKEGVCVCVCMSLRKQAAHPTGKRALRGWTRPGLALRQSHVKYVKRGGKNMDAKGWITVFLPIRFTL